MSSASLETARCPDGGVCREPLEERGLCEHRLVNPDALPDAPKLCSAETQKAMMQASESARQSLAGLSTMAAQLVAFQASPPRIDTAACGLAAMVANQDATGARLAAAMPRFDASTLAGPIAAQKAAGAHLAGLSTAWATHWAASSGLAAAVASMPTVDLSGF
jgi:hypothetical protein